MCGIFGFVRTQPGAIADGAARLRHGITTLRHRGPDGEGTWLAPDGRVGLAHTRLSIIDLDSGAQPLISAAGNVITYNGEIYNYIELRKELGGEAFRTSSDTEVILRAYERWGHDCVTRLRGMFAFALWDNRRQRLFIARDRFGIKPFYYCSTGDGFFFASEIKALLPYLPEVKTDIAGLRDYMSFQFCLGDKTMFSGVRQLPPAHSGVLQCNGAEPEARIGQYWEVEYRLDWSHPESYFTERLREHLADSVRVHLRSDVEVGAYLSGGLDSSLIASMAREERPAAPFQAYTGKFSISEAFDESPYARRLAERAGMLLHEIDISERDFAENITRVLYHLDQPVAGPGSFPQYMVSKRVRQDIKVVLGGQGGDEIFGGYARYLIAYWEQCIKGALDGTMNSGNFVVTYESIIPNLQTLRAYKPLIQEFWSEGLFEERDRRYYRLINRSNTFGDIVDWSIFDGTSSFEDFKSIFWGANVQKESYFDSMTHFDFKTLLPALLHVEDRMSMAHGIESRVPFLDHGLVELAATIPSSIKFKNGELKRLLRVAFGDWLPPEILGRKDKMGFPVPLQLWTGNGGRVREFVLDVFRSQAARQLPYLNAGFDIECLMSQENMFSRNLWALLSLELWQQQFHDRPNPEGT
jgi:asparagine synthase (glutamine-hydrolysing)